MRNVFLKIQLNSVKCDRVPICEKPWVNTTCCVTVTFSKTSFLEKRFYLKFEM